MNDIRIDKDGIWYYRGAEMFRRDIVKYFYDHLTMDDEGRYLICLPENGESCYVDVEDTAYVVKSVDITDGQVVIRLSDDSTELLDLSTLHSGEGNVLYCKVKNGTFPARFNRASYYQLAAYLEHDNERNAYYLTIGNQRFYLP